MDRPIPGEIVACLERLGEALAAWCEEGRDRTLAEHEAAVLARVRAALPALLTAAVTAATSGLQGRQRRARAACPGCGRKAAPWEAARARQVVTQCGAVALARPWYHCRRCRRGWSVVETTLGVPPRAQASAGLERWVLELAASLPYREAAERLASLTGLAVPASTLRRHAVAAGAALAAADAAGADQVERTREPAGPVDAAPGLLVTEADGVMVRYRDGWHEVKVGLVGGWEDGRLRAPSYVAARAAPAAFGALLAAEHARRGGLAVDGWHGGVTGRGLARLRPTLVLGDGAAWIWALADEHLAERIEVVDAYHAAEHLAAVARACLGDTPAAAAWAADRRDDLLARGPGPVLDALAALPAATPEAREARRLARGYVARNAERMDYPSLRADGLPVGSGAVESAAAHVVQARLKRPGMRWSDPGASAVLALRTRLRSGRPLLAA
jgi:hypothetical protein